MNGISSAETTFIIALLTALTTLVPVAALVLSNYLRSKIHELQIQERPTKSEVETLIENKVTALTVQSGGTVPSVSGVHQDDEPTG